MKVMKIISLFVLLIAVTVGMAFAERLSEVNDAFHIKYYEACIVDWTRVGGPPANDSTASTSGAVYDAKGNRRHPNMRRGSGGELINNRARNFPVVWKISPVYDKIYFTITQGGTVFSAKTTTRLFVVNPGVTVVFPDPDKNGEQEFWWNGKLYEDTDFAVATNFKEVMDMYARAVPTSHLRNNINSSRKNVKTDDELADQVITSYAVLSGGWGSLTGAAPAFLMPSEFGANMVTNMMKAQLAYALSVIYRNESTGDDLRDDLLIFFAGDDVEATIQNILKDTGKAGAQNVAQDLTKAGLKKASVKLAQNQRLVNQVASKMSLNLGRSVPVLGIIVGGALNVYEVKKFGEQAKKYYRPK
jgi:hypothetical protein